MKQRSEVRNCFSLDRMRDSETQNQEIKNVGVGELQIFCIMNSHLVALVNLYSDLFWKIPCRVPKD